jgi:ankyrin repeat protein
MRRSFPAMGVNSEINTLNNLLINEAMAGNTDAIKELLGKGADVNVRILCNSPLNIAADRGDLESARLLIENGADPNIPCSDEITPLITAASKGFDEIVKLLIKKGADTDARDDRGKTALIMAAIMGCSGAAKILIENGANPQITDNDGKSALQHATENGQRALIELLTDETG